MKQKRIKKAVDVIKYAIDNGMSLAKASIDCGYSRTYVKNVKRELIEQYDEGIVKKKDYDFFMSNFNLYEGSNYTKKTPELNVVNEAPPTVTKDKKIEGETIKKDVAGDTMNVTWTGDKEHFLGSKGCGCDCEGECQGHEDDGLMDEGQSVYGHQGYPLNHITTLDQLLERCQVDLTQWNVARYQVNKWDVTSWKQGFPQTWENFQVKATLEKNVIAAEAKTFEEIFRDMMKNYTPPTVASNAIPTFNWEDQEENNMLEVSLFDLHFGKLGWKGEVGENFDTKIARSRFLSGIERILAKAKHFQFNKILFPIGNDFFNSDNQFQTTTKGTFQDEDLRWQKTYTLGCKLIVDGIMLLKATGVPVEVIVVPGNHDMEKTFYLGSFVEAWFREDPQVEVNNSAKMRKYIEWGEVMLGFTHGNEEKENALHSLMSTEEKEMWGRTSYREWHLGHFHRKRNVKFTVFDKAQLLNEEHALTVRYLSSLTGTEEWHYKKGYVGTTKACDGFIWNDKEGLLAHLQANFIIGK